MPPFLSLLPSYLLFSPHLLSQLKVEPAAQSHTPQHHGELIGKLSTMESSLESRFCRQAGKEMFGFKTALEAKWVKYSPNQTMLFSWERLPHSEFHFFHFVSLFASTGTELPMMAMTWVLNSLPPAPNPEAGKLKSLWRLAHSSAPFSYRRVQWTRGLENWVFNGLKFAATTGGIYLLWSNYFILSQF